MATCNSEKKEVLVCYGYVSPEKIHDYGFVILEPRNFKKAEIAIIKKNNDHVLAYISIGEVNERAPHYGALKDITLGENQIWNSHYLNLENPKTTEVLNGIVSKNLQAGFDGMFLDNLDNYTIYGPQKDQKDAAVKFMKNLREKFPNKIFVQNAGLDLVPETASSIDGVLIESVATAYDFKSKTYQLSSSEHFTVVSNRLEKIHTDYKVPIILVEYADTKKLRGEVLNRITPLNFPYFIGKIDLQSIPTFK